MIKKIYVYAVAIVFAAGVAYAAPAESPKTGQVTSYDTGTSDDGALQRGVAWPDPRFTVGAGAEVECVTDNLTGLMWTKNANLPAGTKTWQQALDYVTTLNSGAGLCDHTDWRLPNVNELESLVHAEYTNTTLCGGSGCSDNAAWLNSQGSSNVQAVRYWSCTTYAGDMTNAWTVSMSSGGVYLNSKINTYYVWPVRSGQ